MGFPTSGSSAALRATAAVFLKELRETLRDPNALVMSVLFPVLVYPALVWGANLWVEYQSGQQADERAPVVLIGPAADVVRKPLTRAEGLVVVAPGDDVSAALAAGQVTAVVSAEYAADGGVDVQTRWRSDVPLSSRARTRIADALESRRKERVAAEARAHGLPANAGVVTVTTDDAASRDEVLPWLLSLVVPAVLVLNGMVAGFYPAIEAAVGERERGTLETTLVCAAPRSAVIAGKLACVFAIAVASTVANFGALLLSVMQLLHMLEQTEAFALEIPWPVWAGVLACGVVAALVLNAWVMVAVIRARDFKQAQNIASLFLVVGMALCIVGSLPGIGPELGGGLIPVTNLALVMREWIAGRPVMPWAAFALIENLALTAVPVLLAARVVSGEGWRFGSPERKEAS
jgi:sodium transport system permease protein